MPTQSGRQRPTSCDRTPPLKRARWTSRPRMMPTTRPEGPRRSTRKCRRQPRQHLGIPPPRISRPRTWLVSRTRRSNRSDGPSNRLSKSAGPGRTGRAERGRRLDSLNHYYPTEHMLPDSTSVPPVRLTGPPKLARLAAVRSPDAENETNAPASRARKTGRFCIARPYFPAFGASIASRTKVVTAAAATTFARGNAHHRSLCHAAPME